jgi:uncharacterized membrane protein YedE/YeeE
MNKYAFLIMGAAFGFILSRAGATTYDFYAQLFLFQNLQLLWVIVTAATVGAVGVALMKAMKARTVFGSQPIVLKGKPYVRSLVPGALLFGMGWGLAGACPGTALVMLGEGKLGALFTTAGILLGTYLHGLQQDRSLPPSAKPAATVLSS